MSIGTIIYLAEVSDNLRYTLGGINVFLLISSVVLVTIAALVYSETNDTIFKLMIKLLKYSAGVVAPLLFLSIFIPTSKTIYLMTGVSVLEDIANNKKVQETGGKVLDLLNKKIDELNNNSEDKSKVKDK